MTTTMKSLPKLPDVRQVGNMIHLCWMLLQSARKYGSLENQAVCFHKLQLVKEFAREFYFH